MHWKVELAKKNIGIVRDVEWFNDLSLTCKMSSAIPVESESLIYTEVTEDLPEPTVEEIEEYAKRIGIAVESEPHLLFLAREGIQAKLPPSWSPCLDTTKNSFYYFNKDTLRSQWEHPMDSVYRDRVIQARGELTMNRPLSLQPLNMRLPPVKKSGGSLAPMNRASVAGSLGNLGGFGPAAGDLRNLSLSPPSSLDYNEETKSLHPMARHNNANSKNIISNSTLNTFKDMDDDESGSPPLVRPPRKSGLTLTGGGANFLKGSDPDTEDGSSKLKTGRALSNLNAKTIREGTPDSEDSGGKGDFEKRPIKSILVNSFSRSRPSNPSENVYELDGFSMNLEEMTEEERMVLSQLDSLSLSKAKGNVKFNLEENTELKFEMPEDDFEEDENYLRLQKAAESEAEEESSDGNRQPTNNGRDNTNEMYTGSTQSPTPQQQQQLRELKVPVNKYSEAEIAAMKAEMRKEMENELKKFEEQLLEERKSRQEQIQKHLQETVRQFRIEKDETLKRIKKDMESEKATETDKAKREMEGILQKEIAEMKSNFDDALQQRKKELEEETEKKLEALTLKYRKQQEDKVSEALQRQSVEEMLQGDHYHQLNKVKEHHKSVLEKLKLELEEEEETLRQDHILRRSAIVSQFEQETEKLRKELVRSQEEMLKKIQEEFEVKRSALEKSLTSSLQDMKDLLHQNKRSASDINISSDKAAEDELRSMKFKYQQLEGNYHKMRKELEQITNNISATENRQNPVTIDSSGSNNKKDDQKASLSFRSERQSPRKASKKIAKSKSFEASDSAHGSESNTDSNSSVYPSSDGATPPSNTKLIIKRSNTADDPVEELTDESYSLRINTALQALEVLKQEILDLKQTSAKKHAVERKKPPPGISIGNNYKALSARRTPSKQEDITGSSKRNLSLAGHTSSKGSKSARVKVSSTSPSPATHDNSKRFPPKHISRSFSTIPQEFSGSNSEPISVDDAHLKIVENAKAFIRLQKNRLKDPTPIDSSSHLILPTTKNNLLLFDDKLLKAVSPRRPASVYLDLFSETESSGVSSLKDHRSTERKKLSKDIDEICNSLNSLDQQMKFMWSVVKGKQGQGQHHQLIQAEPLSYLNAAIATNNPDYTIPYLPNSVPMLLGKPALRVPSSSLPTSARKPGAPRNYSNLLTTAQNTNSQTVLDALRMSGLSTSRLDCSDLLKSLEEELREFTSTKERLLDLQNGVLAPSSVDKNNCKPNNSNTNSAILEKTKDLQEWLKKY